MKLLKLSLISILILIFNLNLLNAQSDADLTANSSVFDDYTSEFEKMASSNESYAKLFPDSSAGKLTIIYENYEQTARLNILDGQGTVVYERPINDSTTLSLGSLKSGMYLVQLKLGKQVFKQSVIKL